VDFRSVVLRGLPPSIVVGRLTLEVVCLSYVTNAIIVFETWSLSALADMIKTTAIFGIEYLTSAC
jgi:hypothetical protein